MINVPPWVVTWHGNYEKQLDGCLLTPASRVPQIDILWLPTDSPDSLTPYPFLGLSYRNLQYCLFFQQVFSDYSDCQDWACWNCQNSKPLTWYLESMLNCAKTLLVLSKPTAAFLRPGALNSRSSLTFGLLRCPACLLQTSLLSTPSSALLLSSLLLPLGPWPSCCSTLQNSGCALEVQWGWLEPETVASFNFVTTLKALSRAATCLVGFPWKGKIVLLPSWQHLSAMMLAANPNQCRCLPGFFEHPDLSGSLPWHHKHLQQAYTLWFCSHVCAIQYAGVWLKTPPVHTVMLVGGEGICAPLLLLQGVLNALHLTKPFSCCTSYHFIDCTQNSLFPHQTVNLMRAAASLPCVLHFLPDCDFLAHQAVGSSHILPTDRAIWKELLQRTLNMHLLFILVFCWLCVPSFF